MAKEYLHEQQALVIFDLLIEELLTEMNIVKLF